MEATAHRPVRRKEQVMRYKSMCDMEVSGLKNTSRDRLFDAHAPHRHHITAPQQCCMQRRPPTRAIGRKQPSDHPRATCADRRRSTVAPTSRATASPRTPQPRHHAKALIDARQRMCGSLVDSKKRSRNALPKSMEHGQHGMRHRHATGALAVAGQRSEAAVRRQRRQQPRSVR